MRPASTVRRLVAIAAIALAAGAATGAWLVLRTPPRYFTAAEVDRVARPLEDIGLAFPPGEQGIDYYGTLRLQVFIGEDGRVDGVDVIESTVPAGYRDLAVAAFRRTPFAPALRKGRPVKSVKTVQVRFEAPIRELNRGA